MATRRTRPRSPTVTIPDDVRFLFTHGRRPRHGETTSHWNTFLASPDQLAAWRRIFDEEHDAETDETDPPPAA